MGFLVLPGDTIVVWDQMFDAVDYFNPAGTGAGKDRRLTESASVR